MRAAQGPVSAQLRSKNLTERLSETRVSLIIDPMPVVIKASTLRLSDDEIIVCLQVARQLEPGMTKLTTVGRHTVLVERTSEDVIIKRIILGSD